MAIPHKVYYTLEQLWECVIMVVMWKKQFCSMGLIRTSKIPVSSAPPCCCLKSLIAVLRPCPFISRPILACVCSICVDVDARLFTAGRYTRLRGSDEMHTSTKACRGHFYRQINVYCTVQLYTQWVRLWTADIAVACLSWHVPVHEWLPKWTAGKRPYRWAQWEMTALSFVWIE